MKITKVQLDKYIVEHRKFNKRLKQQHRHNERLTLQEYIDYCHGKVKTTQPKTNDYKPSSVYRRETPNYPSLDTGGCCTGKVESSKYTGTLVTGIATMHKSNVVPVINQEQAEEISKMRRG